VDGSNEIESAFIDPSATGKHFARAKMELRGDLESSAAGLINVVATLPEGTSCTGGSDGASCLVSFVTADGYGNFMLVSQSSDDSSSDCSSSSYNSSSSDCSSSYN